MMEIIKKHEGLRLHPYLCPSGVPTIGYGNTRYENGKRVKLTDTAITEERASELLSHFVLKFENAVKEMFETVLLSENQIMALTSFSYNVGTSALKNSTLRKVILKDPCNYPEIIKQFSRWNKGGGKVLAGLTKRRKEESELYTF